MVSIGRLTGVSREPGLTIASFTTGEASATYTCPTKNELRPHGARRLGLQLLAALRNHGSDKGKGMTCDAVLAGETCGSSAHNHMHQSQGLSATRRQVWCGCNAATLNTSSCRTGADGHKQFMHGVRQAHHPEHQCRSFQVNPELHTRSSTVIEIRRRSKSVLNIRPREAIS